jgi:hypothetical protein
MMRSAVLIRHCCEHQHTLCRTGLVVRVCWELVKSAATCCIFSRRYLVLACIAVFRFLFIVVAHTVLRKSGSHTVGGWIRQVDAHSYSNAGRGGTQSRLHSAACMPVSQCLVGSSCHTPCTTQHMIGDSDAGCAALGYLC